MWFNAFHRMAAVTAGIGASGAFGGVKSGFLQAGLRGATSSAITQGIGVATGLQNKFSWAGVAAAGVGAAVGHEAGKLLGATSIAAPGGNILRNYAANLGKSGASMIANAATRSLVEGTDFGDNVLAALPDVIAQTVGDLLFYGVKGGKLTDAQLMQQVLAPPASAPPGAGGASATPTLTTSTPGSVAEAPIQPDKKTMSRRQRTRLASLNTMAASADGEMIYGSDRQAEIDRAARLPRADSERALALLIDRYQTLAALDVSYASAGTDRFGNTVTGYVAQSTDVRSRDEGMRFMYGRLRMLPTQLLKDLDAFGAKWVLTNNNVGEYVDLNSHFHTPPGHPPSATYNKLGGVYDNKTIIFSNNPTHLSVSTDVFLHETGHAVAEKYNLYGDKHVAHHYGVAYTGSESVTHVSPNPNLLAAYNTHWNSVTLTFGSVGVSYEWTPLDNYYVPRDAHGAVASLWDGSIDDARYLDESAAESFSSYILSRPALSIRQPSMDSFWRTFGASKGW